MNTSKNNKQEIRTPIAVMVDMARNEISNHVFTCMQNNHIPPSMMVYVIKDILLDIYQLKSEQMSEEFVEMQKIISENEVRKKEE